MDFSPHRFLRGLADAARTGENRRWLIRTGLALLMAAAALSMGRAFVNALKPDRSDDFQWEPARLVLEGRNPYEAFVEDHERPRITTGTENNALPNYPVTGYVFLAPFAVWDWGRAKVLWALTNVGCAIGFVGVLYRMAGPPASAARLWGLAAGLLMLCSAPARDQVSSGQHTVFSIACLLLAWVSGNHPGGRWWSPLLIAASWLKFSVTVPLTLAFLIHRRWREPAAALLIHLALLPAICLWLGESPVALARDYLEATRLALFDQGIESDVWDSIAVGRALMPGVAGAAGVLSLGCLGIVTALAWRRRNWGGDALETFALLAVPACLVGFHLRYDFVVFALTLTWVLSRRTDPGSRLALTGVALANWFAARWLEACFYQPVDPIHGIWAPAGRVGMGLIAAGTWLALAWWLARRWDARVPAPEIRLSAHHAPARDRSRRRSGSPAPLP